MSDENKYDLASRLNRVLQSVGVHLEPAYLPRLVEEVVAAVATDPIPMRLPCPVCRELHVDEGKFATEPHHTHACQNCGLAWRPAIVNTVGVRFLPGYKNVPIAPPPVNPDYYDDNAGGNCSRAPKEKPNRPKPSVCPQCYPHPRHTPGDCEVGCGCMYG